MKRSNFKFWSLYKRKLYKLELFREIKGNNYCDYRLDRNISYELD